MTDTAAPTTTTAGPAPFCDELTGLYNRRFWSRQFPLYSTWALQNKAPLTLCLLDVDNLKQVNETAGYAEGNSLLIAASKLLKSFNAGGALVRENFLPVRYAGDKFCLLMPGVTKNNAIKYMEELAETVRNTPFQESRITVSIGVANFPQDTADATRLMALAEEALRAAQRGGRDRVSAPADAARQVLDKESLHLLFPSPNMYGRDELFRRARQLLSPAVGRSAPVLVIYGAIGHGKSRFLEELYKLSQPPAAQAILCRSLPFLMRQPFGALLEALQLMTSPDPRLREQMVSRLDAYQKALLSPLLPEWSRLSILDARADEPPPGEPMAHLEEAFASMLLSVTQKPMGRPLVMLLDDVQWLDHHTLGVLRRIKTRPEGRDAAVVMAVRSHDESAESNAPLQQFFHALWEQQSIEFHGLDALTISELGEWLSAVVPSLVLPPAVLEVIHRKSNGIPVLVEEVMKYLVYSDAITVEEREIKVKSVRDKDIPDGLQSLLKSRTQNLDEELLSVLGHAAVVGAAFDFPTLQYLERHKSEGHLVDVLERASMLGLVREVGQGQWSFCSQGAYETFYNALPEVDRRKLHADVARFEEERMASVGPSPWNLSHIAFHYQAAGQLERASAVLAQATLPTAGPLVAESSHDDAGWGVEKELSPDGLHKALQLVRTMKSATQNYRAFAANSEVVTSAQSALLEELKPLFEESDVISFSTAEGTLLVNGRELPTPRGLRRYGDELSEVLGQGGLSGLSFKKGVSLEEVRVMVSLLCQTPEEVERLGGWQAVLEANFITHIRPDERVYVGFSERNVREGSMTRRLGGRTHTMRRLKNIPEGVSPLVGEAHPQKMKEPLAQLMGALEAWPADEAALSRVDVERLRTLQLQLVELCEELTAILQTKR